MKVSIVIGMAVFALGTAPSLAAVPMHMASLEQATWKVSENFDYCQLSHAIPGYGTATFTREIGQALRFEITVPRGPKRTIDNAVKVMFQPPVWQSHLKVQWGKSTHLYAGNDSIRLKQHRAQQLLDKLAEGKQPIFVQPNWKTSHSTMKVGLSPIKFRKSYQTFLRCVENMPVITLAKINKSAIYFDSASVRLNAKAQSHMHQIKRHMKDIKSARQIRLYGFSDSIGRTSMNKLLTERRLESVRKQLIAFGIPEDKITAVAIGERQAVGDNSTATGRAKNRRVEIHFSW